MGNMSPLSGFSNNPLRNKDDLVLASEGFLRPLLPYFSPRKARVRLSIESGAHFDDVAAQLEGFARPLWIVASLLSDPEYCVASRERLLQPWLDGMREGPDPSSPEYWGEIGDWDQRMVEAEIVSFSLLTAPEQFHDQLPDADRAHVVTWLKGMNGKIMPENNWRWFRVLSNLALIKTCGQDRDTLWPEMEKDLQTLESFYIGDGWSSDGVWKANHAESDPEDVRSRQADYYSGSFAIQFSQMIYALHGSELDPERSNLFRCRAREFARSFWAYFDTQGSAIPFGRSLTYRFAAGAFYAAFAYTGLCDDSEYVLSHGAVKGMLLRHLRGWALKSDNITNTDGTLNIGYAYPNMYLSEDYNSPQSPYWALKALLIAGMKASHPFWQAEELLHPLSAQIRGRESSRPLILMKPARQILCNPENGNHHFLLSSGQFCSWTMKATEAKYAKFAYSSAFGFSVPTGTSITQIAPDNTLALSADDGQSWAVRWRSMGETGFVDVKVAADRVPALLSRWRPWPQGEVEVETTLIAPCAEWPDWHIRFHRIRGSVSSIPSVEGGFAIDGRRFSNGRSLWVDRHHATSNAVPDASIFREGQGALETPSSSLIISQAGASGVLDLSPHGSTASRGTYAGEVLKVDPNTNLMTPRTLIPTLRRKIDGSGSTVLMTGVFAVSTGGNQLSCTELLNRWARRPKVEWKSDATFTLSSS